MKCDEIYVSFGEGCRDKKNKRSKTSPSHQKKKEQEKKQNDDDDDDDDDCLSNLLNGRI